MVISRFLSREGERDEGQNKKVKWKTAVRYQVDQATEGGTGNNRSLLSRKHVAVESPEWWINKLLPCPAPSQPAQGTLLYGRHATVSSQRCLEPGSPGSCLEAGGPRCEAGDELNSDSTRTSTRIVADVAMRQGGQSDALRITPNSTAAAVRRAQELCSLNLELWPPDSGLRSALWTLPSGLCREFPAVLAWRI